MFNDLLTSSRGPGVIGTVLGVVVLLGFAFLFLMVTDDRFIGRSKDPAHEIRQHEARIEDLHEAIATARNEEERRRELGRVAEEAKRVGTHAAGLRPRVEQMEQEKDAALKAMETTRAEWDAYRERYRNAERASAKGERYERLETQSGRVYEDVEVIQVDAVRMQVRHKGGISGIDVAELPKNLQDRFQFDSGETDRKLGEEIVEERFRELGKRITDTRKNHAARQQALANARKEKHANEARMRELQSQIEGLPQLITAKRSELAAEAYKRVRNTERIQRELQELESRQAALPGQLAALRAKSSTLDSTVAGLEAECRELEATHSKLVAELEASRAADAGQQ